MFEGAAHPFYWRPKLRIPDIYESEANQRKFGIYSGILRMKDLAESLPGQGCHYYIVAPDSREQEVIAQLSRPSFRQEAVNAELRYIPFSMLSKHCEALCMFGDDLHVLRKIARSAAMN